MVSFNEYSCKAFAFQAIPSKLYKLNVCLQHNQMARTYHDRNILTLCTTGLRQIGQLANELEQLKQQQT